MSTIFHTDISIITVNYNGYQDTCQMIDSLATHCTDVSYEVVVVDNASVRNEAEMIQGRYPTVVALRSEVNLGFAGGNNMGIKHATGRYIMLLNNDTIIKDNSLHHLVQRLESDTQIGAVSPKIVFAFEPFNIQFAGYTPLSHITLRNNLIGFDSPDNGQFDTPHPTPYTHGAAMMVRREVIKCVGMMPEHYFLYYEELDWSAQISRCGFSLWYEPRATVFHKESRSTGAHSPLKKFYLTRNRLLFAWRNLRGAERMLSIAYQIGIAIPKNTITSLLHGDTTSAKASMRAIGAFFRIKNKTK